MKNLDKNIFENSHFILLPSITFYFLPPSFFQLVFTVLVIAFLKGKFSRCQSRSLLNQILIF